MKLSERKQLAFSGIYKITNLINGHSYIGQAKNISIRTYEHLRSVYDDRRPDYTYPLHIAIRKYGEDNFDISVLIKCTEEELELNEIKFIEQLHTCKLDPEWNGGYNLTFGGKQNIRFIKLTREQVIEIRKLLATTSLSSKELGVQFNVSRDYINRINVGDVWHDNNILYPIRPAKIWVSQYHFDGTCIAQYDKITGDLVARYPSRNIAALVLGNTKYGSHIGSVINGLRDSAYGFKWQKEDISQEDWLVLLHPYLDENNQLKLKK